MLPITKHDWENWKRSTEWLRPVLLVAYQVRMSTERDGNKKDNSGWENKMTIDEQNRPEMCIARLKKSIAGHVDALEAIHVEQTVLCDRRDALNDDIATWAKNIHKYEQEIKNAK